MFIFLCVSSRPRFRVFRLCRYFNAIIMFLVSINLFGVLNVTRHYTKKKTKNITFDLHVYEYFEHPSRKNTRCPRGATVFTFFSFPVTRWEKIVNSAWHSTRGIMCLYTHPEPTGVLDGYYITVKPLNSGHHRGTRSWKKWWLLEKNYWKHVSSTELNQYWKCIKITKVILLYLDHTAWLIYVRTSVFINTFNTI